MARWNANHARRRNVAEGTGSASVSLAANADSGVWESGVGWFLIYRP